MVMGVEVEVGNVVVERERFGELGKKRIGGWVVVGGEVYGIGVRGFEGELVISVVESWVFVERSGEGSVEGSGGRFGEVEMFGEGERNGVWVRLSGLDGNV